MDTPRLVCSQCGATCSLVEGARQGKQCAMCGSKLVIQEPPPAAPLAHPAPTILSSPSASAAEQVGEIVLPARNAVDANGARAFLAALALPIALEYYGDAERRALLVRGSPEALSAAAAQLASFWPAASLRQLERDPLADWARDGPVRACRITLAEAEYLPLRTWETFQDGDPVQAIFGALLGLGAGEGLWLQVGLHGQAQPAWLEDVQQWLKREAQRGYQLVGIGPWATRRPDAPADFLSGFFLMGVLGLGLGILTAFFTGQYLASFFLTLGALGAGWLWGRLDAPRAAWQRADLALVRAKVVDGGALLDVTLQAAVRAGSAERAEALIGRLAAALSQYTCVGGNRLVLAGAGPGRPGDTPGKQARSVLNVEELSGLWHLPRVADQLAPAQTAVQAVEWRAPDPREVAGFFRIGGYRRLDGSFGAVRISARAGRRNMALFGKPGTGKSTLMAQLALAALQHPDRPAVVVVDAHGDLAELLTGILPEEETSRVRLLDAGDKQFILTVNPLDMHRSGSDPEGAAQLLVDIGRELWKDFWGPRMQIPFSRAVQVLAAVNTHHAPDDQYGLALLSTLVGEEHALRQAILDAELEERPENRDLRQYFERDFRKLSPNMREQIIQPVLSKAYRFRETALLALLSCPQATLDLAQVLERRQLLVINTNMARLGPEASDFVGSLLLNLLLRQVARQGARSPEGRAPVTVLIDEFHTYSGVAWAEWEQQVRKWGGSVVLGTQSLAALRANQNKELPGILTSGTGALFAFAVNGEDADYLARHELGQRAGGPSPDTLVNLPPFHCYARLLDDDGTPGRPFTLRTDPAPPYRPEVAGRVRAARQGYCLPYDEALKRARAQLERLERLAGTPPLSSTGSTAPHTQSIAGLTDALLSGSAPEGEDLADAIARDLSTFFPAEEADGGSAPGVGPVGEDAGAKAPPGVDSGDDGDERA